MSLTYPRVAFLPDTFQEVNGVAHTSRQFEAFARRRQIPFLVVHAGQTTKATTDGSVTTLQLARGPAKFGLDSNLDCDPFLFRYMGRMEQELRSFKPDLIHLTGPGEMGVLGSYLAHRWRIPLVISWHTNLHEYAGKRTERLTGFLGHRASRALGSVAERLSLRALREFYRQARMALAPNQELLELTRGLTDKPVYLMHRGVDTGLFNPAKRARNNKAFRIGYVGRLTAEKNVRLLADVSKGLTACGISDFEVVIVGEGQEEAWLREHIPGALLTGVLRGKALAKAYADMDLFVFPSKTDTFGNVILEALASGVPCVVTDKGGPRFLISEGVSGHVARDETDFVSFAAAVARSPSLQQQLKAGARASAMNQSWDAAFEAVFKSYAA